jgi:hypothetical protein
MCAPNLICRTGGGELFRGELTDRLQHRIAGPPGRPIGDQQRLAHQGVKQIEDGVVVIGTCDGASALEVESTGEHRTPIQQRLFCAVEHVIGPTHRLAQRVMAFLASLGPDQQPGIGDRGDPALRLRSSTPSGRRPVRWPRESRRGADKSH